MHFLKTLYIIKARNARRKVTMLNLIPQVKTLELQKGILAKKAIFFESPADSRLTAALQALPSAPDGAVLTLEVGNEGEGYELWVEEENISLMAEYGHKHGALGVLNANWGDYGHTCSLELSLYGLVLGAEKSWTVATKVGEEFSKKVDFLLYQQEGALDALKEVSALQYGGLAQGLP